MCKLCVIRAILLCQLAVAISGLAASSNNVDLENFHVTWKDQNSTRFDFIFNPGSKLKLPIHIDSINILTKNFSPCDGNSACLFQNGSHIFSYNLSEFPVQNYGGKINVSHFVDFTSTSPGVTSTKDSKAQICTNSNVTVFHYCSTHWNPPSHHVGQGCDHLIDWHSPYSCNDTSKNHELPCYVHHKSGSLIDLTPWVRSSGASYRIKSDDFNNTVKDFSLGVCNEAHDKCGAGVTACYTNPQKGQVESGFLNMTSIKYNNKEDVVIMTSFGEFDPNCTDSRLKTVTRFVCKNQTHTNIKPRLTRATACESIIEWPTIHACQIPEIQVKGPTCALKHEKLGIDVNLRAIMGNSSMIEIPDINLNGKNYKMILGACKGINVTTTNRCEGKRTQSTSACLIQDGANSTKLSKNNSMIVGQITDSVISLSDNRINMDYFVTDKPCHNPQTPGFNSTRRLGTRIEFYCSEKNDVKPTFVGFNDCTYVFEWGTKSVCFDILDSSSLPENSSTKVHGNIAPKNTDKPLPDTAEAKHKQTLDDATRIINKNKPTPEMGGSHLDPHQLPNPQENSHFPEHSSTQTPMQSSSTTKPASTSSSTQPTAKMLPVNPQDAVIQTADRMSNLHRFFMIGLIMVSLTAFIVAIFILDRKTRLGLPLRSMRRQARQTFQPKPVPYTRVDDFNDSLDL